MKKFKVRTRNWSERKSAAFFLGLLSIFKLMRLGTSNKYLFETDNEAAAWSMLAVLKILEPLHEGWTYITLPADYEKELGFYTTIQRSAENE